MIFWKRAGRSSMIRDVLKLVAPKKSVVEGRELDMIVRVVLSWVKRA